eukprot:522243-Ditylum_brightwellii.AAC.1
MKSPTNSVASSVNGLLLWCMLSVWWTEQGENSNVDAWDFGRSKMGKSTCFLSLSCFPGSLLCVVGIWVSSLHVICKWYGLFLALSRQTMLVVYGLPRGGNRWSKCA